jgi:hypothetical protein
MKKYFKQFDVINLPCCIAIPDHYLREDFAKRHNMRYYIDSECWSDARKMFIWSNMQDE